jgi:hypothetical protein
MFHARSKRALTVICILLLSALTSRNTEAQTAKLLAISDSSSVEATSAQSSSGQPDKVPQPGELGSPFSVDHFWNRIGIELGGGYSPVVQKGAGLFDNGFNVTGGVIDHLSRHWNLLVEAQIFGLKGVNYAPNSSSVTFALDVATAYDLIPHAKTSPYVIGGAGYYQLAPGILCNFVGDCTTISDHAVGYNGGIGIRHRLYADRRMEIYAEGRYHYIASGSTAFGQVSLLPISAGIRW